MPMYSKRKATLSGEIFKENRVDIFHTNLEQVAFSLNVKKESDKKRLQVESNSNKIDFLSDKKKKSLCKCALGFTTAKKKIQPLYKSIKDLQRKQQKNKAVLVSVPCETSLGKKVQNESILSRFFSWRRLPSDALYQQLQANREFARSTLCVVRKDKEKPKLSSKGAKLFWKKKLSKPTFLKIKRVCNLDSKALLAEPTAVQPEGLHWCKPSVCTKGNYPPILKPFGEREQSLADKTFGLQEHSLSLQKKTDFVKSYKNKKTPIVLHKRIGDFLSSGDKIGHFLVNSNRESVCFSDKAKLCACKPFCANRQFAESVRLKNFTSKKQSFYLSFARAKPYKSCFSKPSILCSVNKGEPCKALPPCKTMLCFAGPCKPSGCMGQVVLAPKVPTPRVVSKAPLCSVLLTNCRFVSKTNVGAQKRRPLRLKNFFFFASVQSVALQHLLFCSRKSKCLNPLQTKGLHGNCTFRAAKQSFATLRNQELRYKAGPLLFQTKDLHKADGFVTKTPVLLGSSGRIVTISKSQLILQKTQPVLFYNSASLHVKKGEWVKEGSPILTLTHQTLITGDIVQGIPRIEQLFEAFTSPPSTFKDRERTVTKFKDAHDTLHSRVRDIFRKHWLKSVLPIAVRKSLEEIQYSLVEMIQKVYLSQGVLIADKHIEIVIRQIASKGQILDSGSTGLFLEEILPIRHIENANLATPGKKCLYVPAVVGLTAAALSCDSFISAASFQETTRVLSRDAVVGKSDFLRGLKEKVVIGDLISAGTGLEIYFIYTTIATMLAR